MEDVSILEYLAENWGALSTILVGLIVVIFRLKPTDKSYDIINIIVRIIDTILPNRKKGGGKFKNTLKTIVLILIVFGATSCAKGQLNFNAKRISADTLRARVTSLQLPYDWGGTFTGGNRKDIRVNDTTLVDWIKNFTGGGTPGSAVGGVGSIQYSNGAGAFQGSTNATVNASGRIITQNGVEINNGEADFFFLDGFQVNDTYGAFNMGMTGAQGANPQFSIFAADTNFTDFVVMDFDPDGVGIEIEMQGTTQFASKADYSANFTDRSYVDLGFTKSSYWPLNSDVVSTTGSPTINIQPFHVTNINSTGFFSSLNTQAISGGGIVSMVIDSASNDTGFFADGSNRTFNFRDARGGANQVGLEYFADYSANYTDLSIPHVGFFTNKFWSVTDTTENVGGNGGTLIHADAGNYRLHHKATTTPFALEGFTSIPGSHYYNMGIYGRGGTADSLSHLTVEDDKLLLLHRKQQTGGFSQSLEMGVSGGGGIKITDSLDSIGLVYGIDNTANWSSSTPRAIPDIGYLEIISSSIATGALNSNPTQAQIVTILGQATVDPGARRVVLGTSGTGSGDMYICISDGTNWRGEQLTTF